MDIREKKGRLCALVGDKRLRNALKAAGFQIYPNVASLDIEIEKETAVSSRLSGPRHIDGSALTQLRGKKFEKIDQIVLGVNEALGAPPKDDPQGVISHLVKRLEKERKFRESHPDTGAFDKGRYEAIPFELQKLHKELAKEPDAVVAALRKDFDAEESSFFQFRGARLIKGIFPEFGEPLESRLRKLVDGGALNDIDFVLDILRTYEGTPAIQELCKAIVKVVPEKSEYWNEVAAAIESTGVVSGEYGFAKAYEAKRAQMEIWKNDEHALVRAFADWLIESLERMIASEKQRADEGLALRKYKYGVGDKKSGG